MDNFPLRIILWNRVAGDGQSEELRGKRHNSVAVRSIKTASASSKYVEADHFLPEQLCI